MKISLGRYPKNPAKDRKVSVKIDDWDVWGLHESLALIIHPALVKLKEVKHGSPYTDDDDVPDHLKSTVGVPKENEWDTDANHFDRWDYILNEMIWAFYQYTFDYEDQFHSGNIDFQTKEVKIDGEVFFELVEGPKHTHVFDEEGHKKHIDRMKNGLRLFGKYYSNLWD